MVRSNLLLELYEPLIETIGPLAGLPPEVFKATRCQLGVANCVLDVLVAEVSLHSPCIVAFVRQGKTTGGRASRLSAVQAVGLMTAGFGIGQIAGPLMVGYFAESQNAFAWPSFIAVSVLILSNVVLYAVNDAL